MFGLEDEISDKLNAIIDKQTQLIKMLREDLEFIKDGLENSDWDCERCSHPNDMTTVDIYHATKEALARLKLEDEMKGEL